MERPQVPISRAGKKLLQTALGQFGYRIVALRETMPRQEFGLTRLFPMLRDLGFAPKHVVDVGANRGYWTRSALNYFPDAEYSLIEPQDELKTYVQDLIDRGCKIRWINAGASDQPGLLPFTICKRDDSSNFLMSEEEAQTDGLRRIGVRVRTIDEIIASEDLPMPEIVKIDAEGFDLKVFAGASTLIGKTEVFFIEVDLRDGRTNSMLEVVRRMSDSGYELLDVTDLNRSPKYGVLWLMELVFLRKGSRLLDAAPTYE
ncbi:MAG TPA: FkbM family methyltransferase [Candidatus Acidoferrales bacterium]|nr:FkbM family methyltransferase [Candidatus Acidoferrales bacterium]